MGLFQVLWPYDKLSGAAAHSHVPRGVSFRTAVFVFLCVSCLYISYGLVWFIVSPSASEHTHVCMYVCMYVCMFVCLPQALPGASVASGAAGVHTTSLHLHHGRAHARAGTDGRGTGKACFVYSSILYGKVLLPVHTSKQVCAIV